MWHLPVNVVPAWSKHFRKNPGPVDCLTSETTGVGLLALPTRNHPPSPVVWLFSACRAEFAPAMKTVPPRTIFAPPPARTRNWSFAVEEKSALMPSAQTKVPEWLAFARKPAAKLSPPAALLCWPPGTMVRVP